MTSPADWPVATENIEFNGVLAYAPGHRVDPDTVEANGWQDKVAKPNTKAAEKAVQEPGPSKESR